MQCIGPQPWLPFQQSVLLQAVAEVQRRYPEGVPLLSPEEDMSVKESAFRKAQRWAFWVCQLLYEDKVVAL